MQQGCDEIIVQICSVNCSRKEKSSEKKYNSLTTAHLLMVQSFNMGHWIIVQF
jgi:hypothetical protein